MGLCDYHVHSNYSDGVMLWRMLRAAEETALDGVGFADHCNVSDRTVMQRQKRRNGFNLDLTYERRRAAIDRLRERYDVRIFDAVEVDYHPDDEAAIRAFLDEAGFDYVVGSVHFIDGANVHDTGHFAAMSERERAAAVDRYMEMLVAMIESGLVDIVAHPDVIERNPALRGIADVDQYRQVAAALADADCVPEINAGRLLDDYGETHPRPAFLDVLQEEGVRFTCGTDSHTPDQLRDRVPALQEVFAARGLDPVTLDV